MRTSIESWSSEVETHAVRQGETLSKIARKHLISFAEILKANPQIEDPDQIQVGQQISLPTEKETSSHIHKVEKGETLFGIAQKYGLSLPVLLKANPQIKNPDLIRIGERINLSSAEKDTEVSVHRIKEGETLSGIAGQHSIPISKILNANPEIKNPDMIRAGESVRIPEAVDAYTQGVKGKIAISGKTGLDHERFIQSIARYAQETEETSGIPASVTIAQAIVESGWGRSALSRENNFFGIKGEGPAGSISLNVYEYINGQRVKVNSQFRRYNTLSECFQDHAGVVSESPRYREAMQWVDDPKRFVRELKRAGYATDPRYPDLIIGTMDRYNLYQYNKAALLVKEEKAGTSD